MDGEIHRPSVRYKYCFVPMCTNTIFTCPDKAFICVPKDEVERVKWMKAARRDIEKSKISPKTVMFCCEDHFNMESDAEEWMRYCFYKGANLNTKLRLKPGVLPHKFECQQGKRLITEKTVKKGVTVKLASKRAVNEMFKLQSLPPEASIKKSPDLSTQYEPSCSSDPIMPTPIKMEHEIKTEKCDIGVQVNIKAPSESRSVQVTPSQRTVSICTGSYSEDIGCSPIPNKKLKTERSASDTSAIESGGSEWCPFVSKNTKNGNIILQRAW